MEKVHDDEIDLLSLFQTIWDGKWKILSIMAVSLLSAFGFNIVYTTFIWSQVYGGPFLRYRAFTYRFSLILVRWFTIFSHFM